MQRNHAKMKKKFLAPSNIIVKEGWYKYGTHNTKKSDYR